MTNEEYLEERSSKDKRAETHLWRYVDVALPEGEYTEAQRKEAVFRMAHDVAVMQHQTSPEHRQRALEALKKAGMCSSVVVCPPPKSE